MSEPESDDLETAVTLGLGSADYGPDFGVGAEVDDYLVEAFASRGGFATVYRARGLRDGMPVALKVLHQALVSSTNVVSRFDREIEALRRVRHPRIVEVMAHGWLRDGRPYYVMPWLEGFTLDAWIRTRGALSPAEAGAVILNLIEPLAVAHAAGVVHRDIKPSNMIARPAADGGIDLWLIDFGIAKLVASEDGGQGLTSTGHRVGTSLYMAPEQVACSPVDQRTDIYSLGVVLFQLVTGQPPFSAPSAIEVEAQHLFAPAPRASDRAPVPPGLDAVISRCLAKRREDRFADVAELAAAIRAAMTSPGGAPDERAVPMVGLYVGVDLRDDGSDPGDEAFELLDRLVDETRERCAGAGLEIAIAGAASILAVAPASADTRRTAIDLALELSARSRPPVMLVASIHCAPVTRSESGGLGGGPLLRLPEWIARDEAGAWATAEALVDVGGDYQLGPPGGFRRRVLGRI